MLRIDLKRGKEDYQTIDSSDIVSYQGDKIAEMGITTPLISGLSGPKNKGAFNYLQEMDIGKFITLISKAGKVFRDDVLPVNDGYLSPQEYDKMTSLSTGLPITTVQRSRELLANTMVNIEDIIKSQLPNRDLSILNKYNGENYALVPRGKNIGVVCPSNHPAVNALWLMAYAFKIPAMIKPGSDDVFTPQRLVEALYASGVPDDSLYFLPNAVDPEGSVNSLFGASDMRMIFGSKNTVKKYENDKMTKAYGPGSSKIVIVGNPKNKDEAIDLILNSMIADGGTGCINDSTVILTEEAEDFAREVAYRANVYKPIDPLNPKAVLPAIKNQMTARGIDSLIDNSIQYGARDISKELRGGSPRLVEKEGANYLLPTVLLLDRKNPLYGAEFPFPFISVAQVNEEEVVDALGHSLAVTIVPSYKLKPGMVEDLLMNPGISKVYAGNHGTHEIDLKEPHEGYVADFIFEKKAFRNSMGYQKRIH